jgi:hypothetical protein
MMNELNEGGVGKRRNRDQEEGGKRGGGE